MTPVSDNDIPSCGRSARPQSVRPRPHKRVAPRRGRASTAASRGKPRRGPARLLYPCDENAIGPLRLAPAAATPPLPSYLNGGLGPSASASCSSPAADGPEAPAPPGWALQIGAACGARTPSPPQTRRAPPRRRLPDAAAGGPPPLRPAVTTARLPTRSNSSTRSTRVYRHRRPANRRRGEEGRPYVSTGRGPSRATWRSAW